MRQCLFVEYILVSVSVIGQRWLFTYESDILTDSITFTINAYVHRIYSGGLRELITIPCDRFCIDVLCRFKPLIKCFAFESVVRDVWSIPVGATIQSVTRVSYVFNEEYLRNNSVKMGCCCAKGSLELYFL